jgi:hypothetical protein
MIPQKPRESNKNKALWYNKQYFELSKLTCFLIRLRIKHETQSQTPKNSFYLQESDLLWRLISVAEIFSENQSSLPSQSKSFILSKEQPLKCYRGDFSASLSDHVRTGAHRNFSSAQTQWCVSISDGIAGISESDDIATFPFTHGSVSSQPIKEVSRQAAFPDDSETHLAQERYSRFRFHSSDSL